MAKKSANQFTFSDFGKFFEDMSKKTTIIVEKENTVREFISTGNYILDASISSSLLKGGIQNNRITVFAGESGVGKSFLCYNIAREAQKKGYSVIYIDTEFSIELGQLPAYGINMDKFMLIRSNKVEEIKNTLAQFLDVMKTQKRSGADVEKVILFLDSAGQLASNKEVEDAVAGKDKTDMTRAKAMGSLFRIINADLGYLDIPMVVTNHTYETMEIYSQTVMKGGKSLYYTASTIAILSKAKLKTGEEDDMDLGQSGIVLTAKTVKNRLAKPKKVKFELSFEHGMNKFKGLEAFCRPEFFKTVGIAQGKMEVDKSTGEMLFKPGGLKWYIRHLDKSVFFKQLHTKEIFTPEVLAALEPIVNEYFRYKSLEELTELQKEFDEATDTDTDTDDNGFSDDISADELFD
jgi:RecA/RadA recombinase